MVGPRDGFPHAETHSELLSQNDFHLMVFPAIGILCDTK
jgi:hypothetical protein